MDGLWSSPGPRRAHRRSRRANRAALALTAGLVADPAPAAGGRSRTAPAGTRRTGAAATSPRTTTSATTSTGSSSTRRMTYSSAVFETPDQSLADAQRAKYRRDRRAGRARARDARPRDRLGLGRVRPLRRGRARLPRDVDHDLEGAARPRHASGCAPPAWTDLVDIQLRDYRDIEGTYDAIVSIEMLEAVGAEYLATFFEACDRALRPGGRLGLQVITFPDAAYDAQLRGANWIQTYIFPGGLCPSLAVIERATRATRGLLIRGVDDIARALRDDASGLADAVPRAPRRCPRAGLRRALHPDVGVLPRAERGRLRDGHLAGPPDRDGARARGG